MLNKKTRRTTKTVVVAALSVVVVNILFFSVSLVLASSIAVADIIALVNSTRAKVSLPPLTENSQLSEAARNKANDMLQHDYFAHTSPDGIAPWYWIKQAGYHYKAAGENLAINFDTAEAQHKAWMKSTTHRANILNTQYTEIGVAVVRGKIDGQESIVTVEFFGTPFYATADRSTAVPPVVQKAPTEIQGVETQAETILPALPPVTLTETSLSEKNVATPSLSVDGWLDMATLFFQAILSLSTLAAPLVFLLKSYQTSAGMMRKKRENMVEIARKQTGILTEYHLKVHGL